MKKAVLITGVSGSGKSSLSHELKNVGSESYDLDSMKKIAVMINKKTRRPVKLGRKNKNKVKKIEETEWIYKKIELKKLIANQKNDVAYYCGIPFNLDEILPLFGTIIVLSTNIKQLRQRLSTRTSNDFGRTKEMQDWIIEGKKGLEDYLKKKGAFLVKTDKQLKRLAREILGVTS